MYEAEYRSKLMTPAAAVELIPARGTLSMGMAISEPPALLKALEDRVQRRGRAGSKSCVSTIRIRSRPRQLRFSNTNT